MQGLVSCVMCLKKREMLPFFVYQSNLALADSITKKCSTIMYVLMGCNSVKVEVKQNYLIFEYTY